MTRRRRLPYGTFAALSIGLAIALGLRPISTREILAAALHALVTEGFDAMTIEGVAAAAGAGKATVYRRWPDKPALVRDALTTEGDEAFPVPDTGRLDEDLPVTRAAWSFLRPYAEVYDHSIFSAPEYSPGISPAAPPSSTPALIP